MIRRISEKAILQTLSVLIFVMINGNLSLAASGQSPEQAVQSKSTAAEKRSTQFNNKGKIHRAGRNPVRSAIKGASNRKPVISPADGHKVPALPDPAEYLRDHPGRAAQ